MNNNNNLIELVNLRRENQSGMKRKKKVLGSALSRILFYCTKLYCWALQSSLHCIHTGLGVYGVVDVVNCIWDFYFNNSIYVYAALSVWNTFSCKVRSSNKLASFKSSLKSHSFRLSCWLCVCACVCACLHACVFTEVCFNSFCFLLCNGLCAPIWWNST